MVRIAGKDALNAGPYTANCPHVAATPLNGKPEVRRLARNVGRQLLKAGLVDEWQIGMIPILLGGGQRLFERLEGMRIILRKTGIEESSCRRLLLPFQTLPSIPI